MNAVVTGPASDRVIELLQRYVGGAVDEASEPARHILTLAMGSDEWDEIRASVAVGLSARIRANSAACKTTPVKRFNWIKSWKNASPSYHRQNSVLARFPRMKPP